MCGIAGFEARDDDHDEAVAARLIDALRSRGPDAQTSMARSGMHLVQTRLAVIDLSDRVHYPIPNEDETVWLLFNGEIYN
ncbi:MAG: asparagine synthase (glutamine-hydrolyzing), partial [Solirubrobacterales bacterium]